MPEDVEWNVAVASFIIHLLIPILVIAAVGLVRHRDAWVWSWPAWAVDIDYLGWVAHVKWGVPNVHRALFHNAWWLIFAVALAVVMGRKWVKAGRGDWLGFVRAKPGWVLVPYFYASHLILDIFQGGVTLFWPVSLQSFFWYFQLSFDTTRPVPTPQVESETGTYVGVPDVSEVYTWLDAEQFSILLLYLLGLGLLFAYERAQKQFPPRAAVKERPALSSSRGPPSKRPRGRRSR